MGTSVALRVKSPEIVAGRSATAYPAMFRSASPSMGLSTCYAALPCDGGRDPCRDGNQMVKRLPVSTGQLRPLLALHNQPINLVVFQGFRLTTRNLILGWLRAYMLSALIRAVLRYPAVPRARQQEHQRFVPPNPLVLKRKPLKFRTPTVDRDRPVSRRSKPSSRTALIGEQPNPWDLLHPQDAMSRHRGAKPPRRYGRSGEISLLSPEYLLSDERRPFHSEPPDH